MLVEFSVGNYQAFGTPQRVPIKPITLIFGPNGAGKSALLKSLLASRHAVAEGTLYKSKGAADRHPGTFKAMHRNKLVTEDPPTMQFGWSLRNVRNDDSDTNGIDRLDLEWSEITSGCYHTTALALYRDNQLFVSEKEFGPLLDGKLNATIVEVVSNLTCKSDDRPAIINKIKESLLEELKVDDEDVLFPGSDPDFKAFYFDEGLADKLRSNLSDYVSSRRQLPKLIKRIEESCDRCTFKIMVTLSDFYDSLKGELESLVYHGPIRPVYDEIKATDTSDSQSGEWLKLAEDSDLCEKVNHWLASTAGNQSMQVVVSRVVTVHDLRNVMCDNVTLDDIYSRAYSSYIFDRYMTNVKFFNLSKAIKEKKTFSTENQEGLNQILRDFIADKLVHDVTISADSAEVAIQLGLDLPSHYSKDQDGNYAADMSAFPPNLRHQNPNVFDEFDECIQLGKEQKSKAAREFHALLAGRGEMRRVEDFLLKGMNDLLSAKLNQLEDPHQAADLHKVLFVDKRTKKAVQASNLGLGFSQMLPLVISAFACENQLIAIEQPELHLHPALQTEVADLFIQSAKERGNRFLLETHSEHLILRVMRRIRETTRNSLPNGAHPIKPEDVAVLYVQPGENGSTVQELRIDDQGRFLDNWPQGFFEERLDEMF